MDSDDYDDYKARLNAYYRARAATHRAREQLRTARRGRGAALETLQAEVARLEARADAALASVFPRAKAAVTSGETRSATSPTPLEQALAQCNERERRKLAERGIDPVAYVKLRDEARGTRQPKTKTRAR